MAPQKEATFESDQSGADSHVVPGYGAHAVSALDEECCPGVVDPFTLFGVLGGIAGLTIGLRQLVIDNIMTVRRRRNAVLPKIEGVGVLGDLVQKGLNIFISLLPRKDNSKTMSV